MRRRKRTVLLKLKAEAAFPPKISRTLQDRSPVQSCSQHLVQFRLRLFHVSFQGLFVTSCWLNKRSWTPTWSGGSPWARLQLGFIFFVLGSWLVNVFVKQRQVGSEPPRSAGQTGLRRFKTAFCLEGKLHHDGPDMETWRPRHDTCSSLLQVWTRGTNRQNIVSLLVPTSNSLTCGSDRLRRRHRSVRPVQLFWTGLSRQPRWRGRQSTGSGRAPPGSKQQSEHFLIYRLLIQRFLFSRLLQTLWHVSRSYENI